MLKARDGKPSIEALAMLEVSLREKALVFDDDSYDIFRERRNQLLSLSDEIKRIRISRCARRLKELQYGAVM